MKFPKNSIDRSLWLLCSFVMLCVSLYIIYLLIYQTAAQIGWDSVNPQMANELEQRQEKETTAVETVPVASPAAEASPLPESAVINGRIDINRATAEQLQQLSGIGPVKAQAIIEYRERIGGFRNVRQLVEVKGIGPKTYAKILDQVTTGKSD